MVYLRVHHKSVQRVEVLLCLKISSSILSAVFALFTFHFSLLVLVILHDKTFNAVDPQFEIPSQAGCTLQ